MKMLNLKFLFICLLTVSLTTSCSDDKEEPAPPVVVPTITAVDPDNGMIGDEIIITGTALEGVTEVKFGAVVASDFQPEANRIVVVVPEGVATGAQTITITSPDGTDTFDFTVVEPEPEPTITAVDPDNGMIGDEIIITGTALEGVTEVKFGAVVASDFQPEANRIVVVVPEGVAAGAQTITITSPGGTDTFDFTVVEEVTVETMSFNIAAGNANLDQVAAMINEQAPDIVFLRAVDKNTNRSGADVDQAATIAAQTEMNHLFIPAFDYDGGQYGTAILSRYPITSPQLFTLMPSGEGEARPFGYITVEIAEGREVVFAGVQFDDGWRVERRQVDNPKFAEEVVALLGSIEKPVIMGGLFVFATGTEPHIETLYAEFTPTCTECMLAKPVSDPVWIGDHFMYKEESENIDLEVTSYTVLLDEAMNNNAPVVVEFKLQYMN